MTTWAELRELRNAGLAPTLPVVITTRHDIWRLMRHLIEHGWLVVMHKPGDPFPVELLAGLDVVLFLDSCDQAQAVIRQLKERGVQVASLGAWCPCFQRMDYQPVCCEVAREWP
jgi:hypothetical protein